MLSPHLRSASKSGCAVSGANSERSSAAANTEVSVSVFVTRQSARFILSRSKSGAVNAYSPSIQQGKYLIQLQPTANSPRHTSSQNKSKQVMLSASLACLIIYFTMRFTMRISAPHFFCTIRCATTKKTRGMNITRCKRTTPDAAEYHCAAISLAERRI